MSLKLMILIVFDECGTDAKVKTILLHSERRLPGWTGYKFVPLKCDTDWVRTGLFQHDT